MAIDEFTFDPVDGLNNSDSFPTDPENEAAARKQIQDVLDQVSTYINDTLLVKLASTTDGSSGGDNLGMTAIYEDGAETAQGIVEELKQAIVDTVLGDIPDDTLAEAKMANEMKKQAGGVAEYDTVNDHLVDIATHGGIYHKNILHNWDFRNPVNQRDESSYSNAGYTIDRWFIPNAYGTVTIDSGYITLAASGGNLEFIEKLENSYSEFAGETYTFSVLLSDGTVIQCSGEFPESTPGVTTTIASIITDNIYYGFVYSASENKVFCVIRPDDGYSVNVVAVKLEKGSKSTLVNDPPADSGEQLTLCQRHYLRLDDVNTYAGVGYSASTTSASIMIPIPVVMRIKPTVNYTGTVNLSSSNHSGSSGAAISSILEVVGSTQVKAPTVSLVVESSGLTVGEISLVQIRSGGYLEFSADL